MDRLALHLSPQDRLLAITSAGCNVLDYALTGARVVAVDANPRQNHLLALKLAAIRALGFDDFYSLFGNGGTPEGASLYGRTRSLLPERARLYWDRGIRAFDPNAAPGGSFYYSGAAGRFAWGVRFYLERVTRVRHLVERLLNARDLEEQAGLYHEELRPRLLTSRLLRLAETEVALALVGVPQPQRLLVAAHPGGIRGYILEALDRVIALGLLKHNYFWYVYLTGRYLPTHCPEYLREEGFQALKGGLADRVEIRHGTVSDTLAGEAEGFTAFVLLDHMDWMVNAPGPLDEEWHRIFAAARPGARVIFRSGGPDASFLPSWVRRRLVFDAELAGQLHRRDRVGTYSSFHIARIHDGNGH